MKCKQCIKENKKSKVYPGVSRVPAVLIRSYYDEDGNYVQGSPIKGTTEYSCSNGHSWEE